MAGEHVAVHAAQVKKKALQEEEEMSRYTDRELVEDWEFKIVRSATGAFSKPEAVAQLREQEALGGWQLVEKFDNNRLRFKRPAEAGKRDHELPDFYDPYRTQHGVSEGGLAGIIVGIVVLIGGALAAAATYFNW